MKKVTITMLLMFSLFTWADIEHNPNENSAPTQTEVNRSRSCFEEVERAGCKSLKENQKEFRSCMSQNFSSLSTDCRKMLSKLYGNG